MFRAGAIFVSGLIVGSTVLVGGIIWYYNKKGGPS